MAVNDKQIRYLKGLAHPLKPVVMVGNKGITDNVLTELDRALEQHELIKIRISGQDKAQRMAMIESMTHTTHAQFIGMIGHIAILYRAAQDPVIQLP